jgi:hypothetical protein
LIEVPHGATRRRHFEATLRRLKGEFPADLEQFFYVNTDVGSIECARSIARMLVSPDEYSELVDGTRGAPAAGRRHIDSVLIIRGLVARTFIDLNREIGPGTDGSVADSELGDAMTPSLPAYVTRAEDVATLLRMHHDYQALAARAYELVFDAPGATDAAGLILHTYAPRRVEIARLDAGIVAALRRAYEPEVFATLERRPDVDLITERVDGELLAPRALARAVREEYAKIEIEAAENASYRLFAATMGYVHSSRYPGRILCLEINRQLLADPFTPFAEMSISERQARRMAAPIAAAFLRRQQGR